MSVLDVANEVFFTFVSLLLLFAMNTYVFGFNRQKAYLLAKGSALVRNDLVRE